MKITKPISLLAALSVLSGGAQAFAQFEPDTSNDGFNTGYYSDAEDAAAKAETQRLFDSKPETMRRMEYLDRGLTAVPSEDGVLVSWRFLGTDSQSLSYNLYRGAARLNTAPITGSNLLDKGGKPGDEYTLVELAADGTETDVKTAVKAWDKEYIEFPVKKYDTGDYIIDDGAVGDLDGDGQYELLIRRTPKDMNVDTRVAYPIIEAYELDGTYLWTINIGPNEINEHDLNMMVYDFNGDGKSELIMRSFVGTTDGRGNVIKDANGLVTDYSKLADNLAIFTDRQYIVSTPEYLSMYDGESGEEITRTELLPAQEPLSSWSYRYTDTGRLTKRASHHNFGLAYLDGVTPSFVEVRGAWDNVKAAAWHIEDNKFVLDWETDTPNKEDVNSIYGAVNHNLAVVDVDFDGKDEILSGPMAIDHDGSPMYAAKAAGADGTEVKLAHGDAFDVAKMDPEFDGYYVWACHETANLPANIELHDARTGQVIFGYGKTKDCGRSRAADIDPNYRGYEVWGATATTPMNVNGEKIAESYNTFYTRLPDGSFQTDENGNALQATLPMNFQIHWDGDLLSEFLDGTRISEYNYEGKFIDVIMDADGCMSNCGTKAVPVVAADLFGDWRDEVVWKTADESAIRVYSTAIETEYKIPTPMHDYFYRASIAMQNNHYNQPANYSYYFGAETTTVPKPAMYTVHDGAAVKNPDTVSEYAINVGFAKTAAAELKLLIDSPYAYSDNRIVRIDETDDKVVPVIKNDNTLVPVRFISESFGSSVEWNEADRTVTISSYDKNIVMTIDNKTYTVNGAEKTLETAPQIISERTMLPLRAVAEALGKKVSWDGASRLIVIGSEEFSDSAKAAEIAAVLKDGKEPKKAETVVLPTPTPAPAATENPYASMSYDTKALDGTTYKVYIDEDFSSYSSGDAAGWAGTKPAPITNIGVQNGAITFSGTDKGNRNAVYTLPGGMTGKVYIELDWTVGEMTGGSSVGELRFAGSDGAVFLSFRTQAGQELEYNYGGRISNKGLETFEWKKIGSGFTSSGAVHIRAVADFDKSEVTFTAAQNNAKAEITMPFTDASDFGAIEVLAVRNEKNWNWTTSLDNLTFGMTD
ncbi:MAG: stalk domain-containing protein [Candidatus Ornithomonoglobus sp.]